MSLRDKARTFTSLIIFLEALEGRVVMIELRNETALMGKLDYVDAEMNCRLSKVKFRSNKGKEVEFDNFFVKGPNIRFVHIPDDVNVISAIQSEVDKRAQARINSLQSSKLKYDPVTQRQRRKAVLDKHVNLTREKLLGSVPKPSLGAK